MNCNSCQCNRSAAINGSLNFQHREGAKSNDPGQRFPVILPGFLLNFCNENKEATETCGGLGFVGVVAANVLSTQTNDAVFNATLNLLVTFADAPDAAGRQFLAGRVGNEDVNKITCITPEGGPSALRLALF